MPKVDIKRLDSVTNNDTTATKQINDNFQALQQAIENTISRDGTVPNYMDANFDLNSYRIINAGDPVGDQDVVTLKYFEERAGGAIEAAAEAKASASQAASSAQSALVASNNAIGQLAQAEGLLTAAEGQLEDTKQFVNAAKSDIEGTKNTAIETINNTVSTAKSDINTAVDEAKTDISNIVSDAEGSITSIAVTEANKAIANAAQEATDTAKANVNSYVDGTIKPSLQTYVDQAQENANSAATSMQQAALSATAASNYASNASADADNAAKSAGLAANSAAAAATSKTNAKTSETNAKIWAEGTDAQVKALGGEKSAKGWAEASTNLNHTNITNCITEIPQDIKLELNNGVPTLKAGSKVYDGNGLLHTLTADSGASISYGANQKLFYYEKTRNTLLNFPASQSGSGSTLPGDGSTYKMFYNTTDKKVYRWLNNAWSSAAGYSLPICLGSGDGTKIASIDQVFNGFGYIGSTIFALPGVKGLIPNGRNADGSLKNIEYTTNNVIIREIIGSEGAKLWCLYGNSSIGLGVYDKTIQTLSDRPSSWNGGYYIYVKDENKRYVNQNASSSSLVVCGDLSIDSSTKKIISLTPKTAFHAVDYNDLKEAIEANGGGLEIGDIGFAPLGIDETKNKRRYLNGQVISQSQFVSFTKKIKAAIQLYPSLATSETNWQAEKTNSKLGQCGKFVVDDTAGTIRLPCVVNVQGLVDLALIGVIKSESLPNPQSTLYSYWGGGTGDGGRSSIIGQEYSGAVSNTKASDGVYTRIETLNNVYQDNAPVQQEAIQYPYFIQVATGSEESVDVSTEIQLNNPFFFGMHIWSDTAITNASWLISNGSYHSGATYVDFYEWLLKIKNGTLTVDGVSVKAYGASGITDYDYVINTADTTFRLPVKVKLASGNAVVGNGMTLGLTDGTNYAGTVFNSQGNVQAAGAAYGQNVGALTTGGTGLSGNTDIGVTTDPTKSGIETSSQGLKLYFYVGETIQDANVINAAGVLTRVSNSIDRTVASDRETVVGWCMPDYSAGVGKNSNVTYTAEKDGFVFWQALNTTRGTFYVNGAVHGQALGMEGTWADCNSIMMPVSKGDTYNCTGATTFIFYTFKGVN